LYGKRSSNKKTKEVVNKCLGELKWLDLLNIILLDLLIKIN
jgi:hypothetical protein